MDKKELTATEIQDRWNKHWPKIVAVHQSNLQKLGNDLIGPVIDRVEKILKKAKDNGQI